MKFPRRNWIKPKVVIVAGTKYKIVYKEDKENWGSVDSEKKIIYIDPTASKKDQLDTIIHEIAHACVRQAAFIEVLFAGKSEDEKWDLEEGLVMFIEQIVWSSIKEIL